MRTTLDIDDDVLVAAKELARRECKTAGKFMSDLMREALRNRATGPRPTAINLLI
ncbi:MAG: CopG family transcriptional regulator [Gammaproteobacteria bacterium]|nr:CopG family transcriptional regulator [Gammaproteobacteria bacterium]